MTKWIALLLVIVSGCIVSGIASARPMPNASVSANLGTLYTTYPSPSPYFCASIPGVSPSSVVDSTQSSAYGQSGTISFGTNAYVSPGPVPTTGAPGPTICFSIVFKPSGYGTYSGSETIQFASGFIVQLTVTAGYQYQQSSGNVKLKYQVLGVDYAPPGQKSSVNYAGSTMRGTSTSNSSSWTNTTSLTVSASAKASLFGIFNAGSGVSASTSYAQEGDSSNTMTISTTTNMADQIPGPLSSVAGIDHDYDVIWVWLNPEVGLTLTGPYAIQWNRYAYDPQDDANEMEVVPLYVIELKNPSLMAPGLSARLARSWDTSGLGGLTTQDYTAILTADPYVSNPGFNPNTDTSGRFDLQAGETFSYVPAPPGGQPITQTYSLVSQTTSAVGKGASDTRSVGMTVDANTSASIFGNKFAIDIKVSDTYVATNKWSSTINGGSGQTASLSITGPAATDNYTGPTTIQVWKDNVYGSFMFYGLH